MCDLLEVIKTSLKDERFGDGSKESFDAVCLKLNADIKKSKPWSATYIKGKVDGRKELQSDIKELLGAGSCKCDDN
jgi:hypothetical protein